MFNTAVKKSERINHGVTQSMAQRFAEVEKFVYYDAYAGSFLYLGYDTSLFQLSRTWRFLYDW